MKVKELKKGDLLFPVEGYVLVSKYYTVYGSAGKTGERVPWLKAVTKFQRERSLSWGVEENVHENGVLYLGTKKDVNLSVTWSDRFCLADNSIVAVDPATWKRIEKSSQ